MYSQTERVSRLKEFYKDKTVLVTGAHGFKGSWLVALLYSLGAKKIYGLGLPAEDDELVYYRAGIKDFMTDIRVDIRDRSVINSIKNAQPDVVFHLAAQPIVMEGYNDPYTTYTSNVIGTLNIFEGVREINKKVSFINVTTDKVYKNLEKTEGYVETDELMGYDPYSSSKSCAELVSYSYVNSFFNKLPQNQAKIVSNVRAGNVIGGGDYSKDRIIPDLVRAAEKRSNITVRNFDSVRPYQHVLDAVYAYVILAAEQYADQELAGNYNIGPNSESILETSELIDFFYDGFKNQNINFEVIDVSKGKKIKETKTLTLDSSKFRKTFDWSPIWATKNDILGKTFNWYFNESESFHDCDELNKVNAQDLMLKDIEDFLNV